MPAPRLAGVLLAAPVFLAVAAAADPPAKKAESDEAAAAAAIRKEEAESAAAVRKAAETAEVHGVGLHQPSVYRFRHQDVADWPGLVEALRARKGAAARVWDCLSEEARKAVAADGIAERFSARFPNAQPGVIELKMHVEIGFRGILGRRDFYAEGAFKGAALSDEAKRLLRLGDRRSTRETAFLNWELLAAALPKAVPPAPARFRTVRVQVQAGRDVVLVLSCSNERRWEVAVKPGGRVTGVVLCGTFAQELELVDNPVKDPPVAYRAYYTPGGVVREGGTYLPGGYDKKGKAWAGFVADVKEITGKDWVSYQAEYEPGPGSEPYVIRPGAK